MNIVTTGQIKLIIYDLDGTLLDSFSDIAEAVNHGLAACGLPVHTVEAVKGMVGEGINKLVERAVGADGADRFQEVLRLTAEYYKSHPVGRSALFPGVPETLRALRSRGFAQAVLTNKPHLIALDSCARVGLDSLVDFIQGEDAANPLKPHPGAGLALARRFHATPAQCMVVGDGEPDHALARGCGMTMAACTWGVLTPRDLARLKPHHVLDSISDLLLLPALASVDMGA